MSKLSFHEQSSSHKFTPLMPTTQSGEGPNIEASETLGCLRSTRNWADVLVLTLGYHRPGALINERNLEPWNINWGIRVIQEMLLICYRHTYLSPQFRLQQTCTAPLGQRTETITGDVVLAPETEITLMGSADHIREMRQPSGKRKVPRVRLVRPNTFESHLKRLPN